MLYLLSSRGFVQGLMEWRNHRKRADPIDTYPIGRASISSERAISSTASRSGITPGPATPMKRNRQWASSSVHSINCIGNDQKNMNKHCQPRRQMVSGSGGDIHRENECYAKLVRC
ncbi:hypothetical protein IV203_030471 [Nitzschia inconspicua]|uniref:Uncharacterized protein n=1 Tax=Nitzschia inconspicua TaxID=303405 RepID=A0A9K3P7S3_9STRA|nr:hypothetical protein IV203_030471 [Nitzschia inconspicua]